MGQFVDAVEGDVYVVGPGLGDSAGEFGIAEQDMDSADGGLALKGKLPVVHSFACISRSYNVKGNTIRDWIIVFSAFPCWLMNVKSFSFDALIGLKLFYPTAHTCIQAHA